MEWTNLKDVVHVRVILDRLGDGVDELQGPSKQLVLGVACLLVTHTNDKLGDVVTRSRFSRKD